MPFKSCVSFQSTHERKSTTTEVTIEGYLSDVQKQYGGQPDRQLSYINSRPCTLPQIFKCINDIYSTFGSNKNPFVFINLGLPADCYDVNVTPDKRTIYLHDEQKILDHVRSTILSLFSADERSIPVADQNYRPAGTHEQSGAVQLGSSVDATLPQNDVTEPLFIDENLVREDSVVGSEDQEQASGGDEDHPPEHDFDKQLESDQSRSDLSAREDSPDNVKQVARKQTTQAAARGDRPYSSTIVAQRGTKRKRSNQSPPARMNLFGSGNVHPKTTITRALPSSAKVRNNVQKIQVESGAYMPFTEVVPRDNAFQDSPAFEPRGYEPVELPVGCDETMYSSSPVKPLHRFIKRLNNLDISSPVNHVHQLSKTMEFSAALLVQAETSNSGISSKTSTEDMTSAGVDEDAELAARTLSLKVSKNDFFGMTVIGQFNLGFILVLRHDDIFIIDQHASDEKSNYERLLRETVFDSQNMARPKKLELSSIEKLSIEEHLETLRRNGFKLAAEEDETGGRQYLLTALPVTRNITFDTADLLEILALLIDGGGGGSGSSDSVRCTKAKRMFASRACRSSIMIGTALTMERMQAVVWHLGEMDAPWNCPHGRPTMRHLTSLQNMDIWNPDC